MVAQSRKWCDPSRVERAIHEDPGSQELPAMNARPSTRGQTVPQVAVALGTIAVVGVAFAILVSRPSGPSTPGASPSAPIVVATPKPSAPASPKPSAPAQPSADPSKAPLIDLGSASGHDVQADVIDQVGALVKAESGQPGDGMSVRWHDAIVEQVGANAVRITWSALPLDDHIGIGIHDLDGPRTVVIVQSGPPANSDAMGEDRVVVLTFDGAVDADEIVVEVLDRSVDE
jgi:hypothetical protein